MGQEFGVGQIAISLYEQDSERLNKIVEKLKSTRANVAVRFVLEGIKRFEESEVTE